MKNLHLLFIILVFVGSAAVPSVAEPASIEELEKAGFQIKPPSTPLPGAPLGAFRANRMVYTPVGTRRLAGDFSLPDEQSLGNEYAAPTYEPDPNRPDYVVIVDPGRNTYKNKPTFYFGAAGGYKEFESDIGFQYEGLVNNALPPGWSAFASVTLQTYKNRNPVEKEPVNNWYQSTDPKNRIPQTSGRTISASVSLGENGQFFIDTGPLPVPVKRIERNDESFFYTPKVYPQHLYSTVQNSINTTGVIFRRVIGMTQATGTVAASTESFIHNLAFTNGKRWLWGSETAQDWTTGTHEYQPAADNIGHKKIINGVEYPLFMVDSVPPWHRLTDGNPRETPDGVNVPSRYFQEGVNIDLLAPAGKIMTKVPVIGTHRKKQ